MPLAGRKLPPLPPVPPASPPPLVIAPRLTVPHPVPVRPSGPALSVGDQPGGVDKATWQRFRTGKLAPTRTLDLHGRTAQRAFHALSAFLRTAQAEGVRCVEVITGRGSGEAGGVLRRELPLWLNLPELRPLILGAAHPHAANQGAVRLLLRRLR
jgi:DNA-nicking Smr family endonuclease